MASVPRFVPWATWDEWLWVFESAYSSDEFARRAAVARCRTWQLRGGVPHAVEATCLLVEQSFEVSRLGLSMLVTRSVNGLVDAGQQNKQQAVSISMLAESMGLPAWLVDLRHAATHNQLPSMAVLLSASEALLRYFYEHYWTPQKQKLVELRRGAEDLITTALKKRKGDVSKKVAEEVEKTPLATLGNVFLPAMLDHPTLLRSDDLKAALPLLRHVRSVWSGFDAALVDALAHRGFAGREGSRDARAAQAWLPFLLSPKWLGDHPAQAARAKGIRLNKLWRQLRASPQNALNTRVAAALASLAVPKDAPKRKRPSLADLEAHCATLKRHRPEAAE